MGPANLFTVERLSILQRWKLYYYHRIAHASKNVPSERYFLWCPLFGVSFNRDFTVYSYSWMRQHLWVPWSYVLDTDMRLGNKGFTTFVSLGIVWYSVPPLMFSKRRAKIETSKFEITTAVDHGFGLGVVLPTPIMLAKCSLGRYVSYI